MEPIAWCVETGVQVYEGYLWTLTFADKRVEKWLFMDTPLWTALLTLGYFVMVLLGPLIMSPFRPFTLRPILVLYNLAMTLLNGYICVELFYVSYRANYSYLCQPVVHSQHPLELRMAAVLWWFYVSKVMEFLDTLFFILRKKNRQLTFLHVYHHSTMFCFWWIGIKWVAGGSSFFGAMINSFVHTLMYAYYFITAAFPGVNVWWKKYLTVIQMIQFIVALTVAINGIRIKCPFPSWMGYTLVCYMLSFIVLFSNFFIKSYSNRAKVGRNKKSDDENEETANQRYQEMLQRARDKNGGIDWDKTKSVAKEIWEAEKSREKIADLKPELNGSQITNNPPARRRLRSHRASRKDSGDN